MTLALCVFLGSFAVLTTQPLRVLGGLSDHQVVQQGAPGPQVRGSSTAAGQLRISIPGRMPARKIADISAGEWSVNLGPLPKGGPYRVRLEVVGAGAKVLGVAEVDDVLVGDVWVLAGQSNMVGRARLEAAESPDPRVHVLRPDDIWDLAREPLHERRTSAEGKPLGAGLGLRFAKEMVKRTDTPIGLIPAAVGGTTMNQWTPLMKTPGKDHLYGNMLRRVGLAGGKVRGVLWYQGESDAEAGPAAVFPIKFRQFVATLRTDFGDPQLPFIYAQLARYVGQEESHRTEAALSAVREAQLLAEPSLGRAALVSTIDLELEDRVHLNRASLQRLGVRFADVACALLKQCGPLETGPRYAGIRWDGPYRLILRFDHANGRLSAPGRVLGFSVADGYSRRLSAIYRAWILPNPGNEVAIEFTPNQKLPRPLIVWYGRGFDPAANLTDQADLAVPAFGPVVVPEPPSK